jgi:hypothetical protein
VSEPFISETTEDYWDLIGQIGEDGQWELFGKKVGKDSAKNQAAYANEMFPKADIRAVHVMTSVRIVEED